ncbi:Uncharacterized conserved protein, DUF58 family, contains vWF domain [Micrococcales bacterium KH10]|nr:Uncharacterized conserved protein, DUF58 family, contains vWF domain [Micrococcales bacterium KH10]
MVITGRAVILQLIGIVPVLIWPSMAVALAWFGGVIVLAWFDALLATHPKHLNITRGPLPTVRLGESSESVLVVRHRGKTRLAGEIRDAWTPTAGAQRNRHRIGLKPGSGTRLVTALVPTRRGTLQAGPVTIRSWGPLRLAGRQRSIDVPGSIQVLPAFHSRRHLPSRLARLRELDGRAAVQIRGEGTEFDSLREYVIGDDVRSIDWRATARRSEVVVRTWRPERDRRVLIVVDSGRTSAMRVDEGTRLDAGIEAALLLSALASHAGDRVDVIAFDRELRATIPATAGDNSLAEVASGLAPVEPTLVETDWDAVTRWIDRHHRQRSLVVLVAGLEPAAIESGLLSVVARLTERHTVVLASATTMSSLLAEPAATSSASDGLTVGGADQDVFDRAAQERWELDRSTVSDELSRGGVHVIDVPGEELAPKVADRYLSLKASGAL